MTIFHDTTLTPCTRQAGKFEVDRNIEHFKEYKSHRQQLSDITEKVYQFVGSMKNNDLSRGQYIRHTPSLIPSQARTQPKQIKTAQPNKSNPSFCNAPGTRPQKLRDRPDCQPAG